MAPFLQVFVLGMIVAASELFTESQEPRGGTVLETDGDSEMKTITISNGGTVKLELVAVHNGLFCSAEPVTNAQYYAAVKDKAVEVPTIPPSVDRLVRPWAVRENWAKRLAWREDAYPKGQSRSPVVFVTLAQARGYCEWLNRRQTEYRFRLMNVLEWESEDMWVASDHPDFTKRRRRSITDEPTPAENRASVIRNKAGISLASFTCELLGTEGLPANLATEMSEELAGYVGYLLDDGKTARARPDAKTFLAIPRGPTAAILATTFRVVAVPIRSQHGSPP